MEESRLSEIAAEWLGHALCTEPANREVAEAGVEWAYESAGFKPPSTFVWLDSPMQGAIAAIFLSKYTKQSTSINYANQIRHPVGFYANPDILGDLFARVALIFNPIWNKLLNKIENIRRTDDIRIHFPHQAENAISSLIGGTLDEWTFNVFSEFRASPFISRAYNLILGQHDSARMACCESHRDGSPGVESFDGLMTVARNAGWWWPLEDIAVLTERPNRLHRDDVHRLHCPDGPAVLYPDGFGVWAWHGVMVDRRVIERPETITLMEMHQAPNLEIRRILIERYGHARFLVDANAKIIHADEWGTLYRRELLGDEPLVMVKVVNSTREPDGTYKDYFLRVDPLLRPMLPDGTLGRPQRSTALNAVASTFGLTGEQYLDALRCQT